MADVPQSTIAAPLPAGGDGHAASGDCTVANVERLVAELASGR